jgi:trk system potassium uptake protein TrkH
MVSLRTSSRLLSMPILWMGIVQGCFALLSLLLFRDGIFEEFFYPSLVMMAGGFLLFYVLRRVDLSRASFRDALIFATLTWVVTGLLGAFPIMEVTHVNLADGVFESVSALTTTGATILSGLDSLPPTFLMYRQFLQWMGGLGIVIFVVAVLPMLNVGGMRLLKAETPGPIKDDKLSPRISHTSHYLWGVYITITLMCIWAYHMAGMSFFDAIAHSFTTVSTGGFSTHDASLGYFNSHLILAISDVFMLLGAISFTLHYRVFSQFRLLAYFRDEETRVFFWLIFMLSLVLALYLYKVEASGDFLSTLSLSTFHLISFITSTGYAASDLSAYPVAALFLLIIAGYLGGCAGSTAGGNKIIRSIISFKIVGKNINQLIHPRGVFVIKYQGVPVSEEVTNAVLSFITFVAASSLVLTMLLVWSGLDYWAAFSAVAACVNVLGPAFGELGSNFQPVSDAGTWVLSFAMILGRLEYFTVFSLFTWQFWRN